MEEELAKRIIRKLIKLSPKKYAICNISGFILAKTDDFSINHDPLDTNSKKAVTITLEKKKVAYLYVDEQEDAAKKIIGPAKSLAELVVEQEFFANYLTTDEKKLDKVVYDFLNEDSSKETSLKKVFGPFKISSSAHRLAILIEINDPDYLFLYKKEVAEGEREQKIKQIKNSIRGVIDTFYTRYQENIISYLGKSNFLILKDIGLDPKTYEPKFKDSLSSFFYDIEKELRTKVTAGVGNYNKGYNGIKESYEEARTALTFGQQIWGSGRIYHYDNFGVVAPLFSGANPENIIFSKKMIKKLSQTPALYKTIDQYFQQNLSLSRASKVLKIHRNTLIYRLEKVKEITKLDPRVFNDAFQLQIALMLEKYNEQK